MASLDREFRLNPSVEIIKRQRREIFECEYTIHHEINDTQQSCEHINGLLNQLKLLYKFHFMYEEQLLEELNVQIAAEQKNMHEMFLKSIDQLKTENNQCHTPSYVYDVIKLRLDFISNMNNETKTLCDFISNNFG
jgi:hemerythrin